MVRKKIGYIITSHEVSAHKKKVRYLYREEPMDDKDSGWRVFSGDESQEYADDAENFSMFNASTIIDIDPSITEVLGHPHPVAFEFDDERGGFVKVEDG